MNTNAYLEDLQKWQASSHPDLAGREPLELFLPEFAERYRVLHDDLWLRISHLHGTIYVLEQLREFPFDYVYGPIPEFWRLVVENFFGMACVLLYGLLEDNQRDAHTIPRFRNEIMSSEQWLNKTECDLLGETLKQRKFDHCINKIKERVKEIRHHRIAHRIVHPQSAQLENASAVIRPEELRSLFDATHSLFGALCFGSAYITLSNDLMPGTVGGKPRRSSLDKALDAILRDSDFVNRPERISHFWPDHRQKMHPEALRVMNECRKRIGLPER